MKLVFINVLEIRNILLSEIIQHEKDKTNVISNYRIGVNIHASFSTSLFDVKFPVTTLSKKPEN